MRMHCQEKPEHHRPPPRPRHTAGSDGDAHAAGPGTARPEHLSPAVLLALQRSVGNAAVTGLLASRSEAAGAHGHPVQRSAVHEVLRSTGRPLDEPVRGDMESRLGADFSDVRLHTGPVAQRSAAEIGARAYTSGNHVVLGEGGGDQHTLAHELVHVIQQRHGPVAGADTGTGLSLSDPGDRFERAAEETATRALAGPTTAGHGHSPDVQRAVGPGHAVQRVASGPAGGVPVQRADGDGNGPQSHRFSGDPVLAAVHAGQRFLERDDFGIPVTILQQALADLGLPVTVDGYYGPATGEAVERFQDEVHLFATGELDGVTMRSLDQHFLTHGPERAIATDPNRGLAQGTRTLDDDEQGALRGALSTEQVQESGEPPSFSRYVDSDPRPYEERIRDALHRDIDFEYDKAVAQRPERTEANLMGAPEIDRVADAATQATDNVFGRYRTGPVMRYGLNIKDQFEVRSAKIAASNRGAAVAVLSRVQKLLHTGARVKQIDAEHGAVQWRETEQGLIRPIRQEVVRERRDELLDIHRNWPGSASGGEINLQRYRGPDDEANRKILYRLFAMMIHEYIHTLEHPDHAEFRNRQPEQRGGVVLREGMTDFFAKMVWDGLDFTEALRRRIEGDDLFDSPGAADYEIPKPIRYVEWENAARAIGIIGVRNAMAAFFLGQTHLIQMPETT
ncbi:eCIS core domain-containing protein [Actinosynnema sp. CS-041913]|uniref:eCIS core domain-containing protein n=1 Tax=Actinosynnema sp. CS-041913 TaxID=3239917 RepID=UPI003D918AD2